VNKRTFNVIAWATTVIMIGLTAMLLWGTLHGASG
jgi:Mn2+/Fe2+ NRAMP family transporter